MQRLDYPPIQQDALPTPNHQRNKKWSQFRLHNFLYSREIQHKNVPVTVISPLINTFSTEITIIVYSFFNILSLRPFDDVTVLQSRSKY